MTLQDLSNEQLKNKGHAETLQAAQHTGVALLWGDRSAHRSCVLTSDATARRRMAELSSSPVLRSWPVMPGVARHARKPCLPLRLLSTKHRVRQQG